MLTDKLKLLLPVLSIVLFVASYFQFVDGSQFKKEIIAIDKSDINLMQELLSIDGELALNPIDKNILVLTNLLGTLFDKFSVANADIISSGIDKIGEFRDFNITVQGDFLQQIYFLQQIKKNMREFIVINKITGNNTQALFNTRIYGRTLI